MNSDSDPARELPQRHFIENQPLAVRLIGLVIGIQAIAVTAIYVFVRTFTAAPHSVLFSILDGVMALLAGAALTGLARAVLAGRRWARSPAVVCDLLFLAVSWGMLQSQSWVPSVLAGAPALAAVGLFLTPAARQVFFHGGFADVGGGETASDPASED